MNRYDKEKEMIAYRGLYCRTCDYYTDRIRSAAGNLLEIVGRRGEFRIFAEAARALDFDEFIKRLKWLAREPGPCIGGCRGGGAGRVPVTEVLRREGSRALFRVWRVPVQCPGEV